MNTTDQPAASRPAAVVRHGPPPPIIWRVWPLRDGGRHVWSLVVPVAIATSATALTWGRPAWGLAAAGAVLLAMWRYFVPTEYEVNFQGITQRVLGRSRRMAWKSIENWDSGRHGALIVPVPTGLWPRRRMYISWEGRREELTAAFRYYLENPDGHDHHYGFDLAV